MDAMFPAIFPTSLAIKHRIQIQDDLYAIFHYASAAIQFVNEKTTGGLVPWQFDFTIFPQKIFKDNDQVYKDGTTPILTLQEDVIGDIRKRLDFDKVDYVEEEVKTKNLKTERVLKTFNDLFSKLKNMKTGTKSVDYPHRRRVCCVVDRRIKEMGGSQSNAKRIPMFMFDPSNSALPRSEHFVPEIYHRKTKEELLPRFHIEDEEPVRVKDICGITLSFHCEKINQIKCYLWWDGHGMRFEPRDLNTFIPVWFDDEYEWDGQNATSAPPPPWDGRNPTAPPKDVKRDDKERGKRFRQFKEDKEVQKEVDSLKIVDLHFMDFKRAWTMKRSDS